MARVRGRDGRWTVVETGPEYPPSPGPGFALDKEWDWTGTYSVLATERHTLYGPDGWVARIGYDEHGVLDPVICNVSSQNGDVCRLPKGHDGRHVPFSGELIATTGIYVEG